MGRPYKDGTPSVQKRRPPATTAQGRETRLIGLAVDLAEKQMREGTVTSQVHTHFLKLATVREELERQKIENENLLLKARVEGIASSTNSEALAKEALEAFRGYQAEKTPDEFLYDE